MATHKEVIHTYRALYRRLQNAPIDPLAQKNLCRILSRRFRKALPAQGLEKHRQHRLFIAKEHYLPLLQKAFVHAHKPSLFEILNLAFKLTEANINQWFKRPPEWFQKFKYASNADLVGHWPVKSLKVDNSVALLEKSIFSDIRSNRDVMSRFKLDAKTAYSNQIGPVVDMLEVIEKARRAYQSLSSEKLNTRKSMVDFEPVIPLHRTGVPLVFERQKNLVWRTIKDVKSVFSEVAPPFNVKIFNYLKGYIERDYVGQGKLVARKERLKRNIDKSKQRIKDRCDDSVLNYKVHYKLSSDVFLKKIYIEYLSSQYLVNEKGEIWYCDLLSDIPVIEIDHEGHDSLNTRRLV